MHELDLYFRNKIAYTFSDVSIAPMESDIPSRKDIDVGSYNFGNTDLLLPVISSNMKTITESDMSIAMRENGGLGMLHRFNSIEEEVSEFKKVKDAGFTTGVSIGINDSDRERFEKLYEAGARKFCIDIAHGHCKRMTDMIQWIRNKDLKGVYIIAGSVATFEGAHRLYDYGANCIRIGIGSGSICFTRKNTGVGVPQLFALSEIYHGFNNLGISDVKLLSDGGITSSGDICKAMRYADAVMVGSYICGTTETPGKVFKDEFGQYYKIYAGSASAENKDSYGAKVEFVEGVTKKVPFRGHVKYILREIKEALQGSFGLVGARNLEEFRKRCKFVLLSSCGKIESKQ